MLFFYTVKVLCLFRNKVLFFYFHSISGQISHLFIISSITMLRSTNLIELSGLMLKLRPDLRPISCLYLGCGVNIYIIL